VTDGADRVHRDDRLRKIASALSIGGIERHIFLCAQPTTPKCASTEDGSAAWRALKGALKAPGLASAPPSWRGSDVDLLAPGTPAGSGRILRSKVDCLRICEQGPIAVVYPDGVWYRNVTPGVVEQIVVEHLIGGRVVEEYAFAVDGLVGEPGLPQLGEDG
jgi:(2Fe-2S) ferredoxin